MNTVSPDTILSVEECEKERTPQELIDWVEEKNKLFAQTKEGHKFALLHEGLAKKFYEEIYPLSLLARCLYKGHSCVLKPNLGNDSFDALVSYRGEKNPHEIQKIEFTQAVDGYDEYLRMVYHVEHGHVNLLGRVTHKGTKKTGLHIEVENEMVEYTEVVTKGLRLIGEAAQRKKEKPYGRDTMLVIVFDDNIAFRTDQERAKLEAYVQAEVLPMKLDFGKLYLLGLSGNTLLEFSL